MEDNTMFIILLTCSILVFSNAIVGTKAILLLLVCIIVAYLAIKAYNYYMNEIIGDSTEDDTEDADADDDVDDPDFIVDDDEEE